MNQKVQFLSRLFTLLNCKIQLLEFLKDEKLINKEQIGALMVEHESYHASSIHAILSSLNKEDKLQLLDYEWVLLPKERLVLTIVTNNAKKQFEYSV